MQCNPSTFKGPNRPVQHMSWNDAIAFCKRLNEILGASLPEGRSFALPTQHQWEYAFRAGSTEAFKLLTLDKPHIEVGAMTANSWGIYSMYESTLEWCADMNEQGRYRVFHCGNWCSVGGYCKAPDYSWYEPGDSTSRYHRQLGFRVALVLRSREV